jgi:hypothetical protein
MESEDEILRGEMGGGIRRIMPKPKDGEKTMFQYLPRFPQMKRESLGEKKPTIS